MKDVDRIAETSAGGLEAADFATIFAETRSRVVHTAFLIVGSLPVAEEIAQEAFVRLLQHFDAVVNPGAFLRTAVVRLCLTWRSRAAQERSLLAAVDATPMTGEPEIDSTWDALTALRPERRAAIVLRFYEDLSFDEIAKVMGTRTTTARTRVHRGLADLRKELGA
jgi:RNA polymerase sigma factor (sigma-70 family)